MFAPFLLVPENLQGLYFASILAQKESRLALNETAEGNSDHLDKQLFTSEGEKERGLC